MKGRDISRESIARQNAAIEKAIEQHGTTRIAFALVFPVRRGIFIHFGSVELILGVRLRSFTLVCRTIVDALAAGLGSKTISDVRYVTHPERA